MVKKSFTLMSSFDWKKNEDRIKEGLVITATITETFFGLRATNVKPAKTSLDIMDIIKLASGICGRGLEKHYANYKK